MIKNFETYINEDYFSKLANRKETGNVRAQNKTTGNVRDMKPIRLNWSLAIADRNLDVDGETFFSYQEVCDMNLGEWRLPTEDEISGHLFAVGGDGDGDITITDEHMIFMDEDGSFEICLDANGIKTTVNGDGDAISKDNGIYMVDDDKCLNFSKKYGWSVASLNQFHSAQKIATMKSNVRLVKDL